MPSIESLSVTEMFDLQGHPVTITTFPGAKSGTKLDGNVFTIDPVSRSVVLIIFEEYSENPSDLLTVMGDSIVSIDKCDDLPSSCRPFSVDLLKWMNSLVGDGDLSQTDANSEENTRRRRQLVEWLKKNYITVVDKPDGSLLIFDAVRVTAPFRSSDCICDNGIVLERVKNIVAKADLSCAHKD